MRKLINNIKTTFFGAVAGLPLLIDGIITKDISKIIGGIGTLMVGFYAKDNDTH